MKLASWVAFFSLLTFISGCAKYSEKVVSGSLTMGHEVRSFIQNGQDKEYWIIDKSGDLYEQYMHVAPLEQGAYIPVSAELKVKELPKMEDGFGAEYDGTYEVIEIISLYPTKQ